MELLRAHTRSPVGRAHETALLAGGAVLLAALLFAPAALLIADAIGVWAAVALYVGSTAAVSLGAELLRRASG